MNNIFDQEPEYALLSILLKYPETYYELTTVKPAMFSNSQCRVIFNSIQELNSQNLSPEIGLLRTYLSSKGLAGYDQLLSHLQSIDYNSKNIKEYENLIVSAFKAKTIMEVSGKVIRDISEGQDVESALSFVRSSIDDLSSNVASNQTSSISDIVSNTIGDIIARSNAPGIRGQTTGYRNVDDITGGFISGDLWILAGRPSMGKTAVMCNAALKTSKAGTPVSIFSLEMSKSALLERLIALESGIDITSIRFGLLNDESIQRVQDAGERLRSLPIYVDSNFSCNLDYIIGTTRKLKRYENVQVVFLDYIQLLAERNQNSTHELGQISRSFKLLSNDLGISSVILSQLNRGVELRDDKRPNLSDLRQSGNLEEDADLVAFLYRDEYYNKDSKFKGKLEFIIKKHRNGETGTLFLNFDPPTNVVTEG